MKIFADLLVKKDRTAREDEILRKLALKLYAGADTSNIKTIRMGGTIISPTIGMKLFTPDGRPAVHLQPDADVFMGADLKEENETAFHFFANEQTYNGEIFGEGDIMLGQNAIASENILWDESASTLYLRGGTINLARWGVDTFDFQDHADITAPTDKSLTLSVPGDSGFISLETAGVSVGPSAVPSPDGTLHVHTSTAGTVDANANMNDLVIEKATTCGLSILTANDQNSYMAFGRQNDSYVAGLVYQHGTDLLSIYAGNNYVMQLTGSTVTVNEDGDDVDFRVETDGNANMIVADGGSNVVAIGGAVDASYILKVHGATNITGNIVAGGTVDGVDVAGANAASFLTLGVNAYMANERVLEAGEGIDFRDGGAGGVLAIDGEDATTTNKGIAKFNTDDFTVSAGEVYVKDGGIDHGSLGGLGDDDHTQYILHSLAAAANDFIVATGDDTYVKKTLAETGAILEGDIDHGNIQGLGTGADHSYIDQDLQIAAGPTFADVFVSDGGTFGISGNELLTFNAAGYATFSECNVGVNTATPVYDVDIQGADDAKLRLHRTAPAAGGAPSFVFSGNEGGGGTDYGFMIRYYDYDSNWRSLLGRGMHFVLGDAGNGIALGKAASGTTGDDTNFVHWMTLNGTDLKSAFPIKILEAAAAVADTATYGQLWVKDDNPNVLMYTDGDGADFTVDVTAV